MVFLYQASGRKCLGLFIEGTTSTAAPPTIVIFFTLMERLFSTNQCSRCSPFFLHSDPPLSANSTIQQLGRIAGNSYVSRVNGRTQPWREPVLSVIWGGGGCWSWQSAACCLRSPGSGYIGGSVLVCVICVSGSGMTKAEVKSRKSRVMSTIR